MRLATREAGTGPATLWLHGYTMDSTLWTDLWTDVPGYRHVGADLPGHGASQAMPAGVDLPGLAAAVAAAMRKCGATRLVAQSFGSCVAVQTAIDHPELVRHLVLGAPTLAGAPAAPGTAERTRQLMAVHRVLGPGPHLAELWMAAPPEIFSGARRHPELYARIAAVVERHRWDELATGAMAAATRGAHTPAALAGIAARTTVVVGAQDMPQFLVNAEVLGGAVGECAVHTVAEAGHLPLLERPAAVAGLISAGLA